MQKAPLVLESLVELVVAGAFNSSLIGSHLACGGSYKLAAIF